MWFFLALYFALWTSISISIIKKLTKAIDPLPLLFINNLFILPFMVLILQSFGGIPKLTWEFFVYVFFASILGVVGSVASIYAIRRSQISLISPISSFNPVFTTLFAAVAIGEIPTTLKFLGIMLVVLGAYLLNISDIKVGLLAPFRNLVRDRGVQLFMLANFLWAITPIFEKQAIFQTTPVVPLAPSFFESIFITFFILPFVIPKRKVVMPSIRANVSWFLLLAPLSALGQWAAFSAISLQNVGYVTAIFKLSTLFTILWGGLFFKEARIGERLLGASVMVAGTLLLIL